MAELDITTITNRSIRGIFALTSRTLVIQAVNVLSTFLLTIFLDPRAFGVFFVVSAAISFLTYFSDIGLAAALIQKKEEITREDLATTFTIQQTLVVVVIAIAFLASPFMSAFYNLGTPGLHLFQALLISFFFSSLKTIPSIILERNLDFQKLIIPQIAETFAFNVVSVGLAINGFGITSFTFAVLVRGIIGVLVIYIIAPWRIAVGINKKSAKKLLSFGIPFQTNSILALAKDDLFTIVLGKILTLTDVGYIGFAQKWALMPLRLVMDNIIRITFPSFSRLQGNASMLKLAVEKSLFTITFLVSPMLVGMVILAPYVLHIIPKYTKWEPSLPMLIFFAINAIFSSVSTPLTNLLNAIGKIKITLRLMVFWTGATWIVTLILIHFLGAIGVSLASAIIASSALFVIYLTKKYVTFDIFRPIVLPMFAAALMGLFLYFSAPVVVQNVPTLLLMIIASGVVYMGILFLVVRREMLIDINTIMRHLRHPARQ